MNTAFGKFVFNWSELLLTTWVVMLVAGAVGASLDWGTVSFLQTLGAIYILKSLVSTATVTIINTATSVFKMETRKK